MRTERALVVLVVLVLAGFSGWWVGADAAPRYTHTLSLVRGESVFVECNRSALSMSRLPDPALAVVLVCYDEKPGETPSGGAHAVKWERNDD